MTRNLNMLHRQGQTSTLCLQHPRCLSESAGKVSKYSIKVMYVQQLQMVKADCKDCVDYVMRQSTALPLGFEVMHESHLCISTDQGEPCTAYSSSSSLTLECSASGKMV